jgi:hypothetical protein
LHKRTQCGLPARTSPFGRSQRFNGKSGASQAPQMVGRLKTKTPPAGCRVPSVPSGVSGNPWVASTTEAASAASHEVVVPLRVFRREPYRLFGSSIPLRCSFTATHEVFRLPSVPIQLNERFILSQALDPLQRPPWIPPLRLPSSKLFVRLRASPLRFPAPSTLLTDESAYRLVPPKHRPLRPFSDP